MSEVKKNLRLLVEIVGICLLIFVGVVYAKQSDGKQTIQEAVMLMYQFDSYGQVYSEHMSELKKITTDEVYTKVTVTNVDRALSSYLKFKGHPSKVNVIKVTDTYLIYNLVTESITENRKFVIYYGTNFRGQIDSIQEAELRDFY